MRSTFKKSAKRGGRFGQTTSSAPFAAAATATVVAAMAIVLGACGSSDGSASAAERVAETAALSETAASSETAVSDEAAPSSETTLAPEPEAQTPSSGDIDCALLNITELQQGLGFAAVPGAIFLSGSEATKAKVAALPGRVKGLRILEPYDQQVGSLPPLKDALDRLQQRADAAAAALDGQDASRDAFNTVAAELQDELTLDSAALGAALTRAGCSS